jgi:hypothetical protein
VPPSAATPRAVPPEIDARFVFARTTRERAEPPARFARPLPADLEDGYPANEDAPPAHFVSGLLCAADQSMSARLVDAVERALAQRAEPSAVGRTIGELARFCEPTRAYCEAAARTARENKPAKKLVGSMLLAGCGRLEDIELFDRRDTPALAVFHYLAARRFAGPKPLFTERVGRAALELATTLDDAHELRMAAFTLASFDDRNAAIALVAMRDTAKRHKNQIAVAGMESKDPEARAMGQEACAEAPKDPACTRADDPDLDVPKRQKDDLSHPERIDVARLARFVTDPNVRRSVGPRIEACARASRTSFECVIRLQLIDRERASQLARKLKPRDNFADRERVAALARFEAAAALGDHIVALGFRPAREAKAGEARTTARELLEHGGHLLRFDAETDHFPNEHDALGMRLARLAGGELDGALFEEEAPPKGGTEPYRVCAYLDGERWCTEARNLGDWYDIDAALGLLNAVLRDRGSKTRYAPLATSDQYATVIAGPAAGISSLGDEGLVELGPGDAARDKGRAAEKALTSSTPDPRR